MASTFTDGDKTSSNAEVSSIKEDVKDLETDLEKEPSMSKIRLALIVIGLCLTIFLISLDFVESFPTPTNQIEYYCDSNPPNY